MLLIMERVRTSRLVINDSFPLVVQPQLPDNNSPVTDQTIVHGL
jgi:hypothetical protein